MCASGYRASVASSILRAAGFTNVVYVSDGFDAWAREGHPVLTGGSTDGSGVGSETPDTAHVY